MGPFDVDPHTLAQDNPGKPRTLLWIGGGLLVGGGLWWWLRSPAEASTAPTVTRPELQPPVPPPAPSPPLAPPVRPPVRPPAPTPPTPRPPTRPPVSRPPAPAPTPTPVPAPVPAPAPAPAPPSDVRCTLRLAREVVLHASRDGALTAIRLPAGLVVEVMHMDTTPEAGRSWARLRYTLGFGTTTNEGWADFDPAELAAAGCTDVVFCRVQTVSDSFPLVAHRDGSGGTTTITGRPVVQVLERTRGNNPGTTWARVRVTSPHPRAGLVGWVGFSDDQLAACRV